MSKTRNKPAATDKPPEESAALKSEAIELRGKLQELRDTVSQIRALAVDVVGDDERSTTLERVTVLHGLLRLCPIHPGVMRCVCETFAMFADPRVIYHLYRAVLEQHGIEEVRRCHDYLCREQPKNAGRYRLQMQKMEALARIKSSKLTTASTK